MERNVRVVSEIFDVDGLIQIRGGNPADGRVLVSNIHGVGVWGQVDLVLGSTGTLPATRGGTGMNIYTANNYIRALSPSALEQRTPSQVLVDIGGAPVSHMHGDLNNDGTVSSAIIIPAINDCILITDASSTPANQVKRGIVIGTGTTTFLRNDGTWAAPVALPAGTSGQTLRHDGTGWVANSNIFNNGTNVGIGTTAPTQRLDVEGQIRIRGGSPAAGRFLGGDVNGVGTWQLVDINASTTGTLTAIRGGTGIALYTANNYIRAFNATTLEQRTPAQVLGDIGAAAAIHTHGNITTAGAIGITANLPIITGAGGALQVGSFGVAANTFCQGNDARLSNQRMPLAHSFLDTGLHFVSGLTVGHVLKATGNDTFTFAALVDTDIPNLHPNKIIQNVSNRFVGDSQIANWNTAHSWGNHAGLYSSILHTHGHISNIGAITSTPVIPASGDCLLLTDATDGNSIRRSVPLGTGTNTFLRNDGAWAVPGGSGAAGSSDLVYSQAVNTDVPINSTTPQAVLSAPLENIAAGDIIEVEINGNILNNSGAVRTFIHSFTLGATTFDYTDGTTIAASASALATHNIRFRFAVIATNIIFFDGYVSRGEPNVAGTRQAIAATTVGHIFNTSANNETGNKNVVYLCRGQNATPTQTFQLRSYKVSVIKAKVMAVIPVTPTGLVVREDNILRALAAWNAVNNATSYPIQVRVNGGAATDAVAFNTWWESDAFTASNLVEVRVAARNAAGTSTYSAWVGVTVTGIPKTPTDIWIADLGSYAQVSWTPSQGATSYMVEHRVNDGTHMFTETIDTSWGSTLHNANDIVHARVAARNANGTSAYSGWVSVTLSGM